MIQKILLFLSACFLMACAGGQSSSSQGNDSSWAGQMQRTAQSFQKLLPYLYNKEMFTDEKNKKVIQAAIQDYRKSIHNIDTAAAQKMLGDDPYVLQSLQSITELTDRAADFFSRGDTKNSNLLLKATTNACFKCHTRQDLGPQSMSWKGFNVDQIKTNAIDKAHLLVSLRQYEEAKLHLANFLNESENSQQFDMTYENALHYYLMIALRGQKTFKSTLSFIQSKILVSDAPTEIHYSLKHWANDLQYWIKNQNQLKPSIASAEAVLKRNKERYSEKNLVNNLIASSQLHLYLMAEKNPQAEARAYSILGRIYDELVIEGFWDLPEIYYEMCIRQSPHTALAQKCFESFRNNITLGYSGSRGTLIPVQEYERMERLRKLAGKKK